MGFLCHFVSIYFGVFPLGILFMVIQLSEKTDTYTAAAAVIIVHWNWAHLKDAARYLPT